MRLVLEGVASLAEIEMHWSLCDVYDYNEALDVKAEATEKAREQAQREARDNRRR